MFDPCTEQTYKGQRIPCAGKYYGYCDNCVLTQLEKEIEHLRIRVKNELEPRIEREKRAYDAFVTGPGI